jgi:PRC-barrel domain
MDTKGSYDTWIGRNAVDSDGKKIGEIKEIYFDDVTGRPEWVAIKTGLVGRGIAPIDGARIVEHTDPDTEADLQLGVTKAQIKDAPDVDEDDDHLSAADEEDLYRHYGFDYRDTTGTGTYGKAYGKLRPDLDYSVSKPTNVVTGLRLRRYGRTTP